MSATFQPADPDRFAEAIRRFDESNGQGPNRVHWRDREWPRALAHAEWLTGWVLRLRPTASEALRLAARCQHIRRWEVPRGDYPATREGYLRWKELLKRRHAELAGAILRKVGYPETVVERVQDLNLKRNLKTDEECQTMEDALCLVFLEHQLSDLISRTSEEKLIPALQKSWAKMSAAGREAAAGLALGERETRLLQRALQ